MNYCGKTFFGEWPPRSCSQECPSSGQDLEYSIFFKATEYSMISMDSLKDIARQMRINNISINYGVQKAFKSISNRKRSGNPSNLKRSSIFGESHNTVTLTSITLTIFEGLVFSRLQETLWALSSLSRWGSAASVAALGCLNLWSHPRLEQTRRNGRHPSSSMAEPYCATRFSASLESLCANFVQTLCPVLTCPFSPPQLHFDFELFTPPASSLRWPPSKLHSLLPEKEVPGIQMWYDTLHKLDKHD